ncbi:hypothetical protein FACS1894147_06060 [Spirochaetia bacterium]|nr:hypothetical protein FACS1894147_06060 [Spirochaetia bacterium]
MVKFFHAFVGYFAELLLIFNTKAVYDFFMKKGGGIGTEREGSLHRALKFRYAGVEGATEIAAAGYVCDGITGDGEIIEVQTGSFGPLKDKVAAFTAKNKVRIVHPIILNKQIDLYDEKGTLLHSRKSPRHGNLWDLFKALLYAPELPKLKNLTIELAPVDIIEKRIADGSGSWRRKGVRIADKAPAAYYPPVLLSRPKDYLRFVPFDEKTEFTVRDLAKEAKISPAVGGKTLYVLLKLDLVERTGKKGNAWVYQRIRKKKGSRTKPRSPS